MAGTIDTHDDDREIADINVTPLVDITLVLLIIFMVTTSVIANTDGVKVDKPDAATGRTVERPNILLVCHDDGTVVVNGEQMADDAAIRGAIRQELSRDPDLQGIVQCDEAARVAGMVHLIDLLRASGVRRYAIATEKPDDVRGS